MIDIEKVKLELETVGETFTDEKEIAPYKSLKLNTYIEFKHLQEALNELERLQQKETPMKVLYFTQERGFRIETCPTCKCSIHFLKHGHEIHNRGNYCDICGKHLDWSDEK